MRLVGRMGHEVPQYRQFRVVVFNGSAGVVGLVCVRVGSVLVFVVECDVLVCFSVWSC